MRDDAEVFVKENIEMELFSTEETVLIQPEEEDMTRAHWCCEQRLLEHPLVQCSEEEPGRSRSIPACPLPDGLQDPAAEDTLIEMEVLRCQKSNNKNDCGHKASGLKWKKLPSQKSRFVVKDVVFLPRDQYLAQIESLEFSQRTEVSTVKARMTVDHSWSAAQMDSRLRLLLRREFGKAASRRIHFTYLQCVHSSRSLFIPSAPEGGWTGARVLHVSALGPLYVLIQPDPSSSAATLEQQSCKFLNDGKDICPDMNSHIISERSQALRTELRTALTSFTPEGVELPLQVERGAVLPSALKAIRKSDFCFQATPIISFCGEETEGHQGPLREFFRLMLQELQKTSLFEGQPGRLLLTSDLSALEDWRYYEAGVLIGWSLIHGGAGPKCLHPALYQLMCGQSVSLDDFSWRDVADIEIQSHLLQLGACSDVRQLSPTLCQWASRCGVPKISCSTEELPSICRRVVKHYVHDRVSRMIVQFTEGLNSCGGLWDVMKCHWEAFAPVMTAACSKPLTLPDFRAMLTVNFSSDCEERRLEQETVAHWEKVLESISDGEASLSFEDLLMFVTGADSVPPLGFSSSITMCFYSQDAVLASVRLPFASTCALELFLPRSVGGAEELLLLLTRAVRESQGFTHLHDGEKEERGVDAVGPTRMTSQDVC